MSIGKSSTLTGAEGTGVAALSGGRRLAAGLVDVVFLELVVLSERGTSATAGKSVAVATVSTDVVGAATATAAGITAVGVAAGGVYHIHHSANPRGLPARYGEVIMAVQGGSAPKTAIPKVQAMLKERPNDPYLHELLGDVLVRANDAKGAANAYKKAASLDKRKSSLLRFSYARALLMSNDIKDVQAAIGEIKSALRTEPTFSGAYLLLAQAYGRTGNTALADLATADQHYYSGNVAQARIFATRAQRALKPNSPDWLRARDILSITAKRK